MYKVLIVEDMDLTREDLISLIDWERYGFELLPDARNGKIGLEYAKTVSPGYCYHRYQNAGHDRP